VDLARQQLAIQRRQCERNKSRGQRRNCRQAEHRKRAGADRRRALPDMLQTEQKPLDFGVEQDALRRRADARTVSRQQGIADIRLEILGARPLDDLSLLDSGKPVRVELDARWTLHGVSKQQKELTRVVREGNGLHARGRSTLVLADHGVVVKATKVLFAEIKVGDAVTITYDLRLVPVER